MMTARPALPGAKHLARIACALAMALAAQGAAGQSPGALRLPVEWITVEDGLPQGMVRTIIQDRAGHMWFGTKDGLVRSDGNRLKVFRHDNEDSTSLSGNHITALLEDRHGQLWVATEHYGVDRYDPRTERFTHVRIEGAFASAHDLAPRTLREDAEGNIWVLGKFGMLSVITGGPSGKGASGSPQPVLQAAASVRGDLQLPDTVRSLLFTPQGDLWLASNVGLLIQGTTAHGARASSRWPVPQAEFTQDAWEEPTALVLDTARSRVWLLRGITLIGFDLVNGRPLDTLRMDHAPPFKGNPPLLDRQGRLWLSVSTANDPVRFEVHTGTLETIRFEPQDRPGFPEQQSAICWAEDRNGNIWVGTSGYGVLKYRSRTERFQRLRAGRFTSFMRADLDGRYIMSIEDFDQVNVVDGAPRTLPIGEALQEDGLTVGWRCVVVDPTGAQWCAAPFPDGRSLLARLGPGPNAALEMIPLEEGDQVSEVLPGEGHDLWVTVRHPGVNTAHGLVRFDARTRRITERYRFPHPIEPREYRGISDWRIDADGTVRMGTLSGVQILHTADERWQSFVHDPDDPRSLPQEVVLSICPDPDDPGRYLWVGTEGGGLVKLDLRSGACERFTTHNGLPNDVIYGILADERRNLWLSTNNGLCRFDPRTGAATHYTKDDGLCGNEFNRYSAQRGIDGRFYFAGVDGVTAFHPEDLYTNEAPSPTRISGMRLANKEVAVGTFHLPGADVPLLPTPIGYLAELVLPYDQRMVTLMFACMDPTAPRKNSYRYKLEGFDEDWVDAQHAAEATFTNLDPGRYTFRVQGRNSAGVWDEEGAAIALVITPPWWGTWWFRILAALAVLAAAYGFYRYRLAQALALSRMRDRIARDLHDEIGSTLSSVAIFSEVAMRQDPADAAGRRAVLSRISQSTSQMMESMNDIVWAVNSRNDDLHHVARRMQEFAVRITEGCGCALAFDLDADLGSLPLRMVQRKNLFLIFKEAVTNAAKHSGCGSLSVRLRRDHAHLVLTVQDDGAGFQRHADAPPSRSGGGNGLGNMEARAAEIRGTLRIASMPGRGTTIELRFVP